MGMRALGRNLWLEISYLEVCQIRDVEERNFLNIEQELAFVGEFTEWAFTVSLQFAQFDFTFVTLSLI
jgi:hypothetical protein